MGRPAQTRRDKLVAFIRDVWDEGRAETVSGYVAPAYTIHHDPGDPWNGQVLDPVGFVDRLLKSRAAFPDQRFAIRDLFEEGDRVCMTWHWTATHLGDLPGFPASGQPITMSGATVYQFDRDDRLTGHWQITDRLGVYMQLQANLKG